VRASLLSFVLLLTACGPDTKADFAALLKSFKQIPDGTRDAKAAQGSGETLAINGLSGSPFPGVPTSVTGGVDILKLRTGTHAQTLTDMDLDGKTGTGPNGDKIETFSIAEGDFLSYAHPYKNRTERCIAWQTTSKEAYLLVKNPFVSYVTACVGTSGDALPTTCRLCSQTACGTECGPDSPDACNTPPVDTDGGTP
jgi:hypothetical protein